MEHEIDDAIAEIESRAHQVGLKMSGLCTISGVPRSTVSRWKTGYSSPNLRTYRLAIRKLSETLIRIEIERRDDLILRHGLPGTSQVESEVAA